MIFDNLTQKYSGLEAWFHDYFIANRALRLHSYILNKAGLTRILEENKSRSLLDVGCGGGQLSIRLKELYPYLSLTGIDLSEGQIGRARRRAGQKAFDIRFLVADAENLPFSDAAFDIVYSFGSAKHWPDPLKACGECWRVLKPGGELLIADATSDATLEQVENFYSIVQFPALLKKPLSRMLYKKLFQHAAPVETYRQIAKKLHMPAGTVSRLEAMPAFLLRTKKS